jgi:hypothetical protein
LVLNGKSITTTSTGNIIVNGVSGNPGILVGTTTYTTSAEANNSVLFSSSSAGTINLPAPYLGASFKVVVGNTSGVIVASNAANVWGSTCLGTSGVSSISTAKTNITFPATLCKLGDFVNIDSDGSKYFIEGVSGATGGIVLS